MRVELVCVGTELLTGKASTHAVGLSERLQALGLSLARETVVGDDPAEMAAVFKEAWRRADVVLCSGGLGPTFDDITRDVWARVLKRRLLFRTDLFRDIAAKFRRRRMTMPPMNRRQAFVLEGAEPLQNPNGTAPGQRLATGRKTLVLLPGPGGELFPMADAAVMPWLAGRLPPRRREARVWRIFGRPESDVDRDMRPLVRAERSGGGLEVVWGILAQEGVVDVKAAVSGARGDAVSARMERIERKVRGTFGADIYGAGREALEEAVGKLLKARGQTVSAAESCTGGLLSERLTRTPGSSSYFIESSVTYANAAKVRRLGVPGEVLKEKGAVSRECALAMAEGLRRKTETDWALSVTGIAGPGGGTAEKPVGLVYIGLAGRGKARAWEHRFAGDRGRIRQFSALWALEHLRRSLLS
jgi:nicotinamide-nucleotide amidase